MGCLILEKGFMGVLQDFISELHGVETVRKS